jgi:RNA polymerase sigma-70 factor (ECF subfamily)
MRPPPVYTRGLPIENKARFATTRWTMVLAAAAAGASASSDEALARLCESYWYPLYAYLRRRGHDADEAQDLTQAFFAHLLDKRTLRHADPARGKFRSFLLVSLKNFVVNEWERQTARKRGGAVAILPLDFQNAEGRFLHEPIADGTPESLFDRAWTVTLLDRVLERLRAEMAGSVKDPRRVEHLLAYLSPGESPASYAETGKALGMSEDAVKIAVFRCRRRLGELLKEEIADTVSSLDQVEDEIRYLRNIVKK